MSSENYRGRCIAAIGGSSIHSSDKESFSAMLPGFVNYDMFCGVCSIINSNEHSSTKASLMKSLCK